MEKINLYNNHVETFERLDVMMSIISSFDEESIIPVMLCLEHKAISYYQSKYDNPLSYEVINEMREEGWMKIGEHEMSEEEIRDWDECNIKIHTSI